METQKLLELLNPKYLSTLIGSIYNQTCGGSYSCQMNRSSKSAFLFIVRRRLVELLTDQMILEERGGNSSQDGTAQEPYYS